MPQAVNLGDLGGFLGLPVYIDMVSVNGNYYGFLTNYLPGGLVRLDFGNSMLNTPVPVNLGNFGGALPLGTEGIQMVQSNGNWLAIIVAGGLEAGTDPRILKLDFGANITNTSPVLTNWGNLGNLQMPLDLFLVNENNDWHGFTVNADNNTATVFDFGTGFNNPPTATNLGSLGGLLNYPTGICALNDGGNWRVFITNGNSASILRLDFGNSLLNVPAVTNLGNPGGLFQFPRDITVLNYCNQIVGFVVDGTTNEISRLDFHNDLLSVPTATSLGNIGNFNWPISLSKLFRVGADLYSFIPNSHNNTLSRVKFTGCTNSSIASSTLTTPPQISYSQPGVYNVYLSMDEGLPTQSSFCQNITVLAAPQLLPVIDSNLCADSLLLTSRFPTPDLWSDGSTLDTLEAKQPGIYWVNTNYYGCNARDSFSVNLKYLPAFSLGNDTAICSYDSLVLSSISPGVNYTWQDGSSLSSYTAHNPGKYKLTLVNGKGCTTADSLSLSQITVPVLTTLGDTSLCAGSTIILQTSIQNTDSLRWNPASGLSNAVVASPTASPLSDIDYIITAYHSHCLTKDTISIKVLDTPVISISKDTLICIGSKVQLYASGAANYQWTPSAGLSNPAIENPLASPSVSENYHVKAGGSNACYTNDSVYIQVRQLPVFSLTPSNADICIGDSIILKAQGGDTYEWLTGIGQQAPFSSMVGVFPAVNTIYQVIGYDSICGIRDTMDASITVLTRPVIEVSKSNDIDCIRGDAQLSASGGAVYNWYPVNGLSDPAIANPIASTDTSTLYYVEVTGQNGCMAKDSIKVFVSKGSSLSTYPVPNAFTPNGDGKNDCFGIKYWGRIGDFEMAVYNRWGQMVFYTRDPAQCWDGSFKGIMQPAGAFVYYIKAKTLCGDTVRKGTVLLIR